MNALLDAIRDSLQSIVAPRFFETERGYQGELIAELRQRLPELGFDGDAIVEQEYQKRIRDHGFRIRPDVIIHVPFDPERFSDRNQGNYVVIELKRTASVEGAELDSTSLLQMCNELDYPLGIFININSSNSYEDLFSDERLQSFAVELVNGEIVLHGGIAT